MGLGATILGMAMLLGTTKPAVADPSTSRGPAPSPALQPTPFRASAALFTDDDLLLVEVRAGQDQITDSLSAYSSRAGVFLPLGELARVLDLAITVYPPEQAAKGWILREDRTLSVDLKNHTVRLGDQTLPLAAEQAAFHSDDLYLRLDLMEKLLPIGFKFDARALILTLQPREPLPFQQRLERERRRRGIGGFTDKASILKVATPYLLYSPPSFDVILDGGGGLAGQHVVGRYDLRAAGDLAFASMQAFASSDLQGKLDDVRLTLGRKDYDGHLLGPLRGTDAEIGDTFTPSLSLGERSAAGRGVFFSSAPLNSGSVFSHLDLRGELPDGWQVEIYVNEVLQNAQTAANQGRYEFLNVPLSYGANTIRLVFYGPHGEQRQEVRHYTFGSGQLDKGKFAVNVGAVQEATNVVQLPPSFGPGGAAAPNGAGEGKPRAAVELEYGLSDALTVVGGLAQYTPVTGRTRRVVEEGLRTSLRGVAVQVDAAEDLAGGEATAFSLAGRLSGISFIARDSEYQGVFYDETQRSGISGALLTRSSELRLDWVERFFKGGFGIPVSLDVQRDEKQDGSTFTTASARLSAVPGGTFLASTLAYSRSAGPTSGAIDTFAGDIEASRLFGAGWQVRSGVQYELLPTPVFQSVFVNLDHALSRRNSLRLALSQALSSGMATNLQITDSWRLKRANISVTTSFDSHLHDFRVGLELSFGLLFDPTLGQYRLVRPGATSGGDVAFTSFIDSNGDGRRQKGEASVANLPLDSQGPEVKTDGQGHALLTGVGAGATARIRVKTDALDEPYALPPADIIEIAPRPGRVTEVAYGLKPVGEVQLRLMVRTSGGELKGVSGLDVQLVSRGDTVMAESHTEYDGTMYVEKLPAGVYHVRIEPAQAKRLGLALNSALSVTVPPQGGYVGNIQGEVVVRP